MISGVFFCVLVVVRYTHIDLSREILHVALKLTTIHSPNWLNAVLWCQ